MTKDISVKPNLNLNWRDRRYKRFLRSHRLSGYTNTGTYLAR